VCSRSTMGLADLVMFQMKLPKLPATVQLGSLATATSSRRSSNIKTETKTSGDSWLKRIRMRTHTTNVGFNTSKAWPGVRGGRLLSELLRGVTAANERRHCWVDYPHSQTGYRNTNVERRRNVGSPMTLRPFTIVEHNVTRSRKVDSHSPEVHGTDVRPHPHLTQSVTMECPTWWMQHIVQSQKDCQALRRWEMCPPCNHS
jgi:hypothetical protein